MDAFPAICEALEAAKVDVQVVRDSKVHLKVLMVRCEVSASDCEYFLLPSEQLPSAASALLSKGHGIRPSRRRSQEVQEARQLFWSGEIGSGMWFLGDEEGYRLNSIDINHS